MITLENVPAGRYQIALSDEAWVEALQDNKRLVDLRLEALQGVPGRAPQRRRRCPGRAADAAGRRRHMSAASTSPWSASGRSNGGGDEQTNRAPQGTVRAIETACPPKRAHQRAAFLGIEHSLTGRRWAERLGDERIALAMAQRHGLPDAICRLLAAREVELEDVPDFLEPTLRKFLPDPSHLKDMDRRGGAAGARRAAGRAHRRVRRLRRRRRHLVGAAAALLPGDRRQYRRLHSRSPQGGLRPQRAGAAQAQGGGRLGRRHGRLRRHRLRAAGRGDARPGSTSW